MIEKDRILLFAGAVDLERAQPSLQVEHAYMMDDASSHFASRLEVLISEGSGESDADRIERLHAVSELLGRASKATSSAEGHPVDTVLLLDVEGSRVTLLPRGLRVVPGQELLTQLTQAVGPHCVRAVGGYLPPVGRNRGNGRGKKRRSA